MPSRLMQEYQRQAARRGLAWEAVVDLVERFEFEAESKCERQNAVRQWAWQMASSRGCWPFWRHGFASRWGRRVERHDYTVIPGYDLIHERIAEEFPEWSGDDGEYRLFEFLLSPYECLPTRRELYERAIEELDFRQTRRRSA